MIGEFHFEWKVTEAFINDQKEEILLTLKKITCTLLDIPFQLNKKINFTNLKKTYTI